MSAKEARELAFKNDQETIDCVLQQIENACNDEPPALYLIGLICPLVTATKLMELGYTVNKTDEPNVYDVTW